MLVNTSNNTYKNLPPINSTTQAVDVEPELPGILKLAPKIFKNFGNVFPNILAKVAFSLFTTPQIIATKARAAEIAQQAKNQYVTYKNSKIYTYQWGNPQNKSVLLLHGWSSHGLAFRKLVNHLLQANYHIIALDAPAHGLSKGTKKTNFLEYTDAAHQVLQSLLPTSSKLYAVVGHSMGGSIGAYLLHKYNSVYNAKKLVIMSSPDGFEPVMDNFGEQLQLTPATLNAMLQHIKTKFNVEATDFDFSNLVSDIPTETAFLWVHDKNDRIVSYTDAINMAEKAASFNRDASVLITHNFGHYQITKSPEIMEQIAEFLGDAKQS